jgi:hypothetical protein
MKPIMRFDPAYGTPNPYPSEAEQYRYWHGHIAWLFNPYTGAPRDPRDIGTDVTGLAIVRRVLEEMKGE